MVELSKKTLAALVRRLSAVPALDSTIVYYSRAVRLQAKASVPRKQTGVTIAQITSQQLGFLIDNLQEEYPGDQHYYIQRSTIDRLKDKGADDALLLC